MKKRNVGMRLNGSDNDDSNSDDDGNKDMNKDVDEFYKAKVISEEEQDKEIEEISIREIKGYRFWIGILQGICLSFIISIGLFYLSPYFEDPEYVRWTRPRILLYLVLSISLIIFLSLISMSKFPSRAEIEGIQSDKSKDMQKKETMDDILLKYARSRAWPYLSIVLLLIYLIYPLAFGRQYLQIREPLMYLVLEIPTALLLIFILADYESNAVMKEVQVLRSLKYKSKSV